MQRFSTLGGYASELMAAGTKGHAFTVREKGGGLGARWNGRIKLKRIPV
jgi:hypothetical protein